MPSQAPKTIGITGGTGFVGRHITKQLLALGHELIIFSRNPRHTPQQGLTYAHWNPSAKEIDLAALGRVDAMIHLAGSSVADKRWTPARKAEILHSRVDATFFLHKSLQESAPHCTAFIAASATGFYGPDRRGLTPFTEASPPYKDFLADVCKQWEEASLSASDRYRTVVLRTGIVLGKDGGAFPKLTGPMAFGIMPILGTGKQIISWIHIDDLSRMYIEALIDDSYRGIFNAVAPNPVSNRSLMDTIAKVKGGLNIPAPVPAFALRLVMGDASVEILKSCTVSSAKVEAQGFQLQYPILKDAISAILNP